MPSGVLSSATFPVPNQTLAFSLISVVLCKNYQFNHGQTGMLRPSLSLCQWNSLAGKQNGLSESWAPALGAAADWVFHELCLQNFPKYFCSHSTFIAPTTKSCAIAQRWKQRASKSPFFLLSFSPTKTKKLHVNTETEKALIAIICMTQPMGIC